MFFFFSKILTLFLFPLPLGLLALFLLSFKIKEKKIRLFILIPVLLLWLFSSFPISQFLIRTLEDSYPPVRYTEIQKADAIVVLGGMINNLTLYDNRIELGNAVERLTDSLILYNQKKARTIIVSGGSGILFFQKNPESILAKKFLQTMGLPANAVITESKSRNTAENALYTKEILQQKNWKKIILVTSAFHMKRSVALFRKQNLDVIPFPTDYRSLKTEVSWDTIIPSTGALDSSTLAIKEWIGILVYSWKGFL